MDIRPEGAEMFHADGRTYRQTWQSSETLFAILRKHQKREKRY